MKRYQICGTFMSLADTTNRPKPKLNCATAAINSLNDAFGIPIPPRSDNVKHMVHALVRAFTKRTYKIKLVYFPQKQRKKADFSNISK